MKKLITLAAALVIGFVIGFVTCISIDDEPETVCDANLLSEEIIEISELSTVAETYTMQVPYQGNAKALFQKPEVFLNEHGIHLFDKQMNVEYEGTVKCGLDMSDFSPDNITIDQDAKSVQATIPHSIVLSHEINEDSWQIIDQKDGLFNPLTPKDDSKLRKFAKKQALEEIGLDKLLSEADTNAQKQITKLLKLTCPDMEVTVTFE